MRFKTNIQTFLGSQSSLTFQDFRTSLNTDGYEFFLYANVEDQQMLLFQFADSFQVIRNDFDSFNRLVSDLERVSFKEQCIFSAAKIRIAFNRKSLHTVADKMSSVFFELEKEEKEEFLEREIDFDFFRENYKECALFIYFLEREGLAFLPKNNFYLNYLKLRLSKYYPLVHDLSIELMVFLKEKLGDDFFCLSDEEKKSKLLSLRIEREFFEFHSSDLAGAIDSFSPFIPKENTQLQLLLACLALIGAPYEWLVYIETVLGEGFFSLSFEAKKGKVANINFDLADLASNFYWFTRAGPTIFTAIAHPQLRLLKYCTERDGERLALPFLFLSELTRQLPLDFFSIKDKAIKASMIATMEFSLDFLIQYGRHLSTFLFSLMERNIKLPENKMYIYVLRLMFPIRFSEHPEQVMLNEFSNQFISLLWNGLGRDFFSLPEEVRGTCFVDYFSNIVLMKRHAKEIHGAMLEFKIKRPMFHFFLKIAQRIPAEELTNDLLDFMMSKLQFDFFACDIEEQRRRFATIDWFDGSIQVSLLFLNALLNTLEDHVAVSNTALGLLKWIDSSCVDINVLRVVAKQLGEDFFSSNKPSKIIVFRLV